MTSGPENVLEAALVAVAEERAGPADLYEALRDAELYVPAPGPAPSEERAVTADEGDEIALPIVHANGRDFVPVFSSMTQLLAYVPAGTGYLRLDGRSLATIWPEDAWMALNPRSPLRVVVSPADVRALAGGVRRERLDAPPEGEYALGEPAEEPGALLDAIARYSSETPAVRAAYRALMVAPGGAGPQHVIGLEVDEGADRDAVLDGAARAGREGGESSIVLVALPGRGTVARFLRERTRPFYIRSARSAGSFREPKP